MKRYWYIDSDFTQARKTRIGASDISALIPHPEKPNETLAGYGRTAVTVWLEKTGRKDRDKAGLPAEVGHALEPLAIAEFIKEVWNEETADQFVKSWRVSEYEGVNPQKQQSPIQHHVQWYDEYHIVHPDGVYDPAIYQDSRSETEAFGFKINLTKPFLIEAKSAVSFVARRKQDSVCDGFDRNLKTWQGIPTKYYMQIQDQLEMLDVDIAYLTLIYDTSLFQVWEIKRNEKHGKQIRAIQDKLIEYIRRDEMPKEMILNQADVIACYPSTDGDFSQPSAEEMEEIAKISASYKHAKEQEKIWKAKKDEAEDAASLILRDRSELRAMVDGELVPVLKWSERKGSERVAGVKEIKDKHSSVYDTLVSLGLVKTGEATRSIKIF